MYTNIGAYFETIALALKNIDVGGLGQLPRIWKSCGSLAEVHGGPTFVARR